MPPRRLRGPVAPRRSRRAAMERLIADRVVEAIAEHERNRPNPDDVEGSMNVQGCSHKTFMNGKPHSFNGTKGVVGLRCWIEKVEQVFQISKCAEQDKVIFAASTFEGHALTWWNGNMHTLGLANANNDIKAYNNRFHELALMCPELVPNEKKKIKRYIRGFPEGIKGTITSSRPTTLHDAINMAREIVEQAVQVRAARISEINKRKWEDQQGNNHHQQQNQRQEATKAYVAAPTKGRGYVGNLPWCNRCKAHHQPGPCPPRCSNCYKLDHEEEDCRIRILVARGNSM
ncbi:hypothetical protein Tco_0673112 [Tanacetum coccineum]